MNFTNKSNIPKSQIPAGCRQAKFQCQIKKAVPKLIETALNKSGKSYFPAQLPMKYDH
ncbi:MAG: hypothetical protein M3R36_05555 [Bacteroidota bacterium]|nr:hypothetical protein [Bacteroidota bacterium]